MRGYEPVGNSHKANTANDVAQGGRDHALPDVVSNTERRAVVDADGYEEHIGDHYITQDVLVRHAE